MKSRRVRSAQGWEALLLLASAGLTHAQGPGALTLTSRNSTLSLRGPCGGPACAADFTSQSLSSATGPLSAGWQGFAVEGQAEFANAAAPTSEVATALTASLGAAGTEDGGQGFSTVQLSDDVRFTVDRSCVFTLSLDLGGSLPPNVQGPPPSVMWYTNTTGLHLTIAPGGSGDIFNVPNGFWSGTEGAGGYGYAPGATWRFSAFLSPGSYEYYLSDSFTSFVQPPVPPAQGAITVAGMLTAEPCLTVLQQPGGTVLLCDSTPQVTLTATAAGSADAGTISYRWQWRPSSGDAWGNIAAGPNTGGSGPIVSFTASDPSLGPLLMDFGPGQGSLPTLARPEFRCRISNACTSVTTTSAVLSTCAANCDCSTAAPVLNVNDFACFLNRYASGDPRANCDGSTAAPVLNVLDFACFLNRFAVGCP